MVFRYLASNTHSILGDTYKKAFTIVELLVVIVVIGILATIVITSYTGISSKAITASLQSDLSNATKQLKMFQIENSVYPTTINCAIPDSTINKCIKSSMGTSYLYAANNSSNPQTFTLTATKNNQVYSISQNSAISAGGLNLLSGDTSVEKSSSNEFVQYYDLAPIFNVYGLRQYTISFDIKSANISVQNTMQVYMQNGSFYRYTFGDKNVPITLAYTRQSVTVTPSLVDSNVVQSMLAFYGTYGTGNKPTIKNVKVELGSVATDWVQASQ